MIKVGVIGFGFMGITHALSIQRNKKLKLQAIITRNTEGVEEKLSKQIGNFSGGTADIDSLRQVPRYTSLQECLRHEQLDAVHVCVHTDLHLDISEDAIESGLHVFLEKPFTLRVEEGKLLIHLARQHKVKLMVGHVVRFMPAYRKLKEWIDTKEYGALKFISLTRFSGLPSWGQWQEKQKDFGSSGGALFDLLIHDIDFLNYALGTPGKIDSTCHPGALSLHDYITAHWHYQGVEAKVEGGNTFHGSFPFQAGYMARFENASVVYTSLKPEFIQVCNEDKITEIPAGDQNDGFYNEIDYFATCIQNSTEPLECTPESSLQTIQLCYAHVKGHE